VLPLGYRFSQALEMQTVWDGALALPKANTMMGYTHEHRRIQMELMCV